MTKSRMAALSINCLRSCTIRKLSWQAAPASGSIRSRSPSQASPVWAHTGYDPSCKSRPPLADNPLPGCLRSPGLAGKRRSAVLSPATVKNGLSVLMAEHGAEFDHGTEPLQILNCKCRIAACRIAESIWQSGQAVLERVQYPMRTAYDR